MRLYLVQHGQATNEDEDPDRPLTGVGAEDVRRVARQAVSELGARPTRIVHSGKTRARQTAEIWGGLLDIGVEESDGLAPKDDAGIWAERVGGETNDVMLVGHLPNLAGLAGLLLTGDADQQPVAFTPGTLVGLEGDDDGWNVWLVLPPLGR